MPRTVELLAKIGAGARSDLFRVARAYVGAAVRTFIIATARPGIEPDCSAVVALILIEKRRLTARLIV
jgi:hypothetical protein